jgi:protein involved in polysaccharide export with SLBB domain
MNTQPTIRSTSPSAPRRARLAALPLFLLASAGVVGAPAAAAQQPPTGAARTAATRPDSALRSALRVELETRAASLEAAGKREEAAEVRRRLAEGDFPVGDRVVLEITGSLTFRDTLPVRAGQVITVGTLPDISLRGVLRPELTAHLTREIGRYVRDPVVHAQSLVRVAVSGAVTRPGFYAMPADILLGDAIMRAGGPTGDTEMKRTVVKRGGNEALSRSAVQRALREGSTLEQIGLRAGDEIVVGKRRNFSWTNAVLVTSSVVGAVFGLVALLDR